MNLLLSKPETDFQKSRIFLLLCRKEIKRLLNGLSKKDLRERSKRQNFRSIYKNVLLSSTKEWKTLVNPQLTSLTCCKETPWKRSTHDLTTRMRSLMTFEKLLRHFRKRWKWSETKTRMRWRLINEFIVRFAVYFNSVGLYENFLFDQGKQLF